MMLGLWQRWQQGVRRCFHRPDWLALTGSDGDFVMAVDSQDDFHAKQGRSVCRWRIRAGERFLSVYLKRHRELPWRQRVLAMLWPGGGWSPAVAEWRHLLWAKAIGIPVPDPVAVGEFIGPRLRLQSYLAVEELQGMLPLHEGLPLARRTLSHAGFHAWKLRLAKEMARIARRMHQAGLFHKDLYLCHYFTSNDDAKSSGLDLEGRVFLIDFHRMGRHSWNTLRWRFKDLAQLLYSSDVPGVDDRDRLRFLRHYLGRRKFTRGDRWFLGLLRWKARHYRRHNRALVKGVRP